MNESTQQPPKTHLQTPEQPPMMPPVNPRPQRPSNPGNGNNTVLITIIICATVIVLGVLAFIVFRFGLSEQKKENNSYPTEQEAQYKSTESDKSSGKRLDIPEGDVAPAKKHGSLNNIGFTADYSDIVCYEYLTDDDLRPLTKSELRILRNTIYARHGRKFKSKDLDNYFRGFSWYEPLYDEVSPNSLSKIEKHNISLIQKYE